MKHLTFHFVQKRLHHLTDSLLDFVEEQGSKTTKKVLKRQPKLKRITPKNVQAPSIFFPQNNMPIEWWYFTGHLKAKNVKAQWGYEFCIFKVDPRAVRLGFLPLSVFRKKPFFLLHVALTNKAKKRFRFTQEITSQDLNKIKENDLCITLPKASLEYKKESFTLSATTKVGTFKFTLTPQKKLAKHYDNGFGQITKNQRTYYVSYSRMNTTGSLKVGNRSYSIGGTSWFDHQKLNKPMPPTLHGWDWFSMILDDGTELMLYTVKSKKKLLKDYPAGSYITKKGDVKQLFSQDIGIIPIGEWTSTKTAITYPSGWKIHVPKLNIKLTITPDMKDQELSNRLKTPVSYWEGSCKVAGTKQREKIEGLAYVELVGYDKRFISKVIQKSL